MDLLDYNDFFFFNDTATTEIYTLSLHDALPIWLPSSGRIILLATRHFILFRKNTYVRQWRRGFAAASLAGETMSIRRAYIIEDEKLLGDRGRPSVPDGCPRVEEFESAEPFLAGHAKRPAGC